MRTFGDLIQFVKAKTQPDAAEQHPAGAPPTQPAPVEIKPEMKEVTVAESTPAASESAPPAESSPE
jgi:hypothetical protein